MAGLDDQQTDKISRYAGGNAPPASLGIRSPGRMVPYLPPCPMRGRDTRPISLISAARKAFDGFPEGAQNAIMRALTVAAEGRTTVRPTLPSR